MMNEVQKMVIELVKAGFPYLECSLSKDMRSEIRVGGRKCHDGFLKHLGGDEWAGRFYGVKFRLGGDDAARLVRNAYEIAYVRREAYVCAKNREILDAAERRGN